MIAASEWFELIQRDYLRDFIRQGGATTKFVVPRSGDDRPYVRERLRQLAIAEGYLFAWVDAAETRLHLIDQLFFAVARQVPWDELALGFASKLVAGRGYLLSETPTLARIAQDNEREETLLREDLKRWLEAEIYRDCNMTREFRRAMIRLCQAQLEGAAARAAMRDPILAWLTGELRLIAPLKETGIVQKISRGNARALFSSLVSWLRKAGGHGLVCGLDIAQYGESHPEQGQHYQVAAALDAYELLRQFLDAADELEGCFLTVLAEPAFLSDPLRGVDRYDALKLRIWDEVRDRGRENPFAALVRLELAPALSLAGGASA